MKKFSLKNILKSQKNYFIIAQIAIALETLFELQLPLIVAKMVDNGILQSDISVIKQNALLYLGILALSACSIFLFGYCAAHASNGIAADLRLKAFSHINKLRLNEVNSITPGALITRMTSDINILQDSINLFLRLAIRGPLQFIGGIAVLLFMDTIFASILAVALVILTLVVWIIIKMSQPLYEEVQRHLDNLNTINQESIVGARTIKAFSGEKIEVERFSKVNYLAAHARYRVSRLMGALQPFFTLVMNIALSILLLFASFAVEMGTLQIGEVMAAISYLSQILFALMMLVMIFPSLSRATISYNRIKEIFELEVEHEDENVVEKMPLHTIESIEFRNISFNYNFIEKKKDSVDKENSQNALHGINFTIHEGEKIAFLGTTGAGKSTLIKILFMLYEPSEGEVYINNRPIHHYSMHDIRKTICYVLQKPDLFNGSIYENITFGNEEYTQDKVKGAAKIAQADDFIMNFEDTYEKKLGSKGIGVSGGQKQRINLSRAFLKSSSLLILDDCTSALDLRTEKNVHKAIQETAMHKSIILISQKIESVKNLDKIYLMDKGRIVACGSHQELILSSELYREFCVSQNFDMSNIYPAHSQMGNDYE